MTWDISRKRRAIVTVCAFLLLLSGVWPGPLVAQGPNSEFQRQLLLAQKLYLSGDLDSAMAAYRQAIGLSPQSGTAYSGLGAVMMDKGILKDAVPVLEQAVTLLERPAAATPGSTQIRRVSDPLNLALTLNNLALAYYQLNRLVDAFARADRAVQTQPTLSNCWNTRGLVLEAQGKLDAAIESYRKAVSISPKSADMAHNLGEALQKKGQIDEALLVLEQGLNVHPAEPELLVAYGNALYAKDRFADAQAAYQKCLVASPDMAAALYGLGIALRFQGKYPDALKALLRAHALAPADEDTTLGLASLYAEMGRFDEAAPLMDSLAVNHVEDPLYLLLEADSLVSSNQGKEALPFLQQALAIRHDFPEAIATLASLQIDLGEIPRGIKLVNAALEKHANSPELHNSYGLLLGAQSKFADAQAEYEKALFLRPNFPDAMVNHAIALARQNHAPEAIAEFQSVLAENPKNLKAQANLGVTLLSAKRYDDAAAAFRLSIALSPSDPDLRTNLGIALEKAGHAAEARKAYAEGEKLRKTTAQPNSHP
jgi:tetratricopeptide (TPR) repeat protein